MIQLLLQRLFGIGLPGLLGGLGARMLCAALTALLIAALGGWKLIPWLRRRNVGERTERTPIEDAQLRRGIVAKSGTPTMGGLIIAAGLFCGCLLWGRMENVHLWLALACFAGLAALGMLDDWMKLTDRGRAGRGLKVRHKLLVQGLLGAGLGVVYWLRVRSAGPAPMPAALLRDWALMLGPAVILWTALIVATMSNAANVTDGLDGLAGGLTLAALLPLGLLAYGPWRETIAGSDPQVRELALFCAALGGAVLGFLLHNVHPARVFMGDTGSLAIGGSIGLVAVLARAELLLPLFALVFLAEFASSVLQVLWFKATGRRILPIAPLHHIPQQHGVPEGRIVVGMLIVGWAAALLPLPFLIG